MAINIDILVPAVRLLYREFLTYYYQWEADTPHPMESNDFRVRLTIEVIRSELGRPFLNWLFALPSEEPEIVAPVGDDDEVIADTPCMRSNPYGRQRVDVGYDRVDYKMCRRRAKHGEQKRRGTRLRDKRSLIKYDAAA